VPGSENGGFLSVLVKKTGCRLAELKACGPAAADVLLLVMTGGIASIWFRGAFWALDVPDVI
jgi:hypothetical protein